MTQRLLDCREISGVTAGGQIVERQRARREADLARRAVGDDMDRRQVAVIGDCGGDLVERVVRRIQHHHLNPGPDAVEDRRDIPDPRIDKHDLAARGRRCDRHWIVDCINRNLSWTANQAGMLRTVRKRCKSADKPLIRHGDAPAAALTARVLTSHIA